MKDWCLLSFDHLSEFEDKSTLQNGRKFQVIDLTLCAVNQNVPMLICAGSVHISLAKLLALINVQLSFDPTLTDQEEFGLFLMKTTRFNNILLKKKSSKSAGGKGGYYVCASANRHGEANTGGLGSLLNI